MAIKKWLYDDVRERYITEANALNYSTLRFNFTAGTNKIALFARIGDGIDLIKVSDRNRYFNNQFYEARAEMPSFERSMPDAASSAIKFSECKIKIHNLDKKYSKFLPFGSQYRPFINEPVSVFMAFDGARDDINNEISKQVFIGVINSEGGVSYDKDAITFSARDTLEKINTTLPLPSINSSIYPNAPEDSIGKMIPFALGDFTVGFDIEDGGCNSTAVLINNEKIQASAKVVSTLPTFSGGLIGYNVGGSRFVFCIGGNHLDETYYPQALDNIVLKRGQYLYELYFNESPLFTGGFWGVEIYGLVDPINFMPLPYIYESGDVVLIKTKMGIKQSYVDYYDDNIVMQVIQFLITCGRLTKEDFFDSFEDNGYFFMHPFNIDTIYSSIWTTKSRFWVGDNATNVLNYALSMMRQVRLDLYSRNGQVALNEFHMESLLEAQTLYIVEKDMIVEDSLRFTQDSKNFFTSARASYAFCTMVNSNALKTEAYFNQTTETLIDRRIDKQIDFPNLYVKADVIRNLKEYVKFFSGGIDEIKFLMAWPALDFELGYILFVSFDIGGIEYKRVPVIVRSLNVLSNCTGVEITGYSLANFAVPGWNPENIGSHMSSWNKNLLPR